jgi:biotin carboxyl carrier protein
MQGFLLIEGEAHTVTLIRDGDGGYAIPGVGGVALDTRAVVARAGNHVWVHLDGRAFELVWRDPVTHYAGEAGGAAADAARAPMPGSVVSLSVAPGDPVKCGDTLLIIESMKLETAIKAPRDGLVGALHVTLGQTFERDTLLVSLMEENA